MCLALAVSALLVGAEIARARLCRPRRRRRSTCRSASCPAIDLDRAAGAHQEAVVGRVRRARARHEGRGARGRLPRRSVQGSRAEAGQHRRHLLPEGAAGRHHADAGAAGVPARAAQAQTLKWKDDVVAWTKHVARLRVASTGLRAGVRRLRRGRARVRLGRLQGRRRQGQDARDAGQRSAGARSRERRRSSIRRRSAARR